MFIVNFEHVNAGYVSSICVCVQSDVSETPAILLAVAPYFPVICSKPVGLGEPTTLKLKASI